MGEQWVNVLFVFVFLPFLIHKFHSLCITGRGILGVRDQASQKRVSHIRKPYLFARSKLSILIAPTKCAGHAYNVAC